MKKMILLLAALAGMKATYAAPSPAMISGNCALKTANGMKLYNVKEGRLVEFASTTLDTAHNFAFAIPVPTAGYYYLAMSVDGKASRNNIRVYLQAGEQVTLDIQDDQGHYSVLKGGEENKLLYTWQQLIGPLKSKTSLNDTTTYRAFFPAVDAIQPAVATFKKSIHTKNGVFNRLLTMTVDADMESTAMGILVMPRSMHPDRKHMPAYYNTILQPKHYCSAAILELGEGADLVQRYAMLAASRLDSITLANRVELSLSVLCNDTLKGVWLMNDFRSYRSLEKFDAVFAPYKQYLLTDNMQKALFETRKALSTFKKGTTGYNFSFPGINGDTVSLASLKGKVVLVDMWATWCGPCKKEIPFMQELEAAMYGKNVAFVSISTDKAEDKEKWKAFVKEKKMGGIQLFAGGWSDMQKFYDVNGIPRFMVFDKQGNIVSVDAPRPSMPELKPLLESLL
ncbi:TlpA family protein disulfide reductase [Chitinophaga pinensis]|uniref:Redoxin domain protein n=1 Tax=Chitinophaga pinensis (strain ATCC 43595 / DSM 2588 / LMG 13176 / NBRC 15968 / NCIMB 11800 / UQM 2034) TaxID=485918 RepID=A0A979G4N7_CHIPD|nr:TlpA disulfide reductase family protein [Chitinophaga pinensis]ACU60759.1 Redoxin domain protein [Chitinophaga pinensis DSM 2588]